MHEGHEPAEEPTALLAAVLRYHDEGTGVLPVVLRDHDGWPRLLPPAGPPTTAAEIAAARDRAVGLFSKASGTQWSIAAVEVDRLAFQLAALSGMRLLLPDLSPRSRTVDRAELEAAAAALLGYYLAGRRIDDELLGEVVAAWAEWEEFRDTEQERMTELGGALGELEPDDPLAAEYFGLVARQTRQTKRYLRAWRRWLDWQAKRGPAADLA